MTPRKSQFMATRATWSMRGEIELRFGVQNPNCDSWYAAQPVVMALQEDGHDVAPFMKVDRDVAQQIVDQLWICGIRPSEGEGSSGQMAATQAHLKDLQRLVFKDK